MRSALTVTDQCYVYVQCGGGLQYTSVQVQRSFTAVEMLQTSLHFEPLSNERCQIALETKSRPIQKLNECNYIYNETKKYKSTKHLQFHVTCKLKQRHQEIKFAPQNYQSCYSYKCDVFTLNQYLVQGVYHIYIQTLASLVTLGKWKT